MKVCKFGGSSLADATQLNKVIDIVLADPARRIVVVSAPGKRDKGDKRATSVTKNKAEFFHLKFLPMMASASSAVIKSHTKTPSGPSMPSSAIAFCVSRLILCAGRPA